MNIMLEKYLDDQYAPENAAKECGGKAEDIERMALEMAHVAFKESITIDVEWTDWAGRKQDKFIGRPVSMHAMRGISAHSNGFQTCRAIHLLQVSAGYYRLPWGPPGEATVPETRATRHQACKRYGAEHAAEITTTGLPNLP